MSELAITVGLPASGKSTFCKEMMRAGYVIVSPDKIRRALHGQSFESNAESFVWATAEVMARALLLQGHNVIIDATNTRIESRAKWKWLAASFGTKLDIYTFQTPIEICKERNDARIEGKIPEDVINRMASEFQNPTDVEGVVRVITEATKYE